ncbi:hypothetical protein [Desulfomicrobium apsheronum]|uniref:hypothetical protein n=1 Tax=Desulfomicrobium apsheronum TaxID=52560 RepID=UPI0011603C5D|nr:hypothetical protein [Desulfomicrobium apsheronum]
MKTKIPPCFAPTAAQRVGSLWTGSQAAFLVAETWDAMKTNAHAWDIPAQMGIHAFLALAKMDSRLRGNDPDKGAKPWCRSMKTKIPPCFAPPLPSESGRSERGPATV